MEGLRWELAAHPRLESGEAVSSLRNSGRSSSSLLRNRWHIKVVRIAAVGLLAVGASACGSRASQVKAHSEGETACVVVSHGHKSRILSQNSGLPCSSIASILKVLSSGAGVSPLRNENGELSWVCRVFPKSALPREVWCHEEGRHFEIQRISDS